MLNSYSCKCLDYSYLDIEGKVVQLKVFQEDPRHASLLNQKGMAKFVEGDHLMQLLSCFPDCVLDV